MFKFVARLFNKSATEKPLQEEEIQKARQTLEQIMQVDNPEDEALAFELAHKINTRKPSR